MIPTREPLYLRIASRLLDLPIFILQALTRAMTPKGPRS